MDVKKWRTIVGRNKRDNFPVWKTAPTLTVTFRTRDLCYRFSPSDLIILLRLEEVFNN